MNSSEKCRFCSIASGEYHFKNIDEPFAVDDNFIAMASIGALVEGWSLIIPRTHCFSMRDYYSQPEFSDFVKSILPNVVNHYGPMIAFEHGANKKGSMTACGTEHAHLHIVPYGNSLLPEMQNSGFTWIECHTSEISKIADGAEYLFYSELGSNCDWANPIGWLHVLEYPKSQYFRRLIANQINKNDVFDYKLFPHSGISELTRITLSRLAA